MHTNILGQVQKHFVLGGEIRLTGQHNHGSNLVVVNVRINNTGLGNSICQCH